MSMFLLDGDIATIQSFTLMGYNPKEIEAILGIELECLDGTYVSDTGEVDSKERSTDKFRVSKNCEVKSNVYVALPKSYPCILFAVHDNFNCVTVQIHEYIYPTDFYGEARILSVDTDR